MNKKSKVLLSSVASIALSASIAVGGTFALFTSESKVNIAVTAGTVNVTAEIVTNSLTTSSSLSDACVGTAEFETVGGVQTLNLTNIVPGDKAEFQIVATNHSNVDVQYRFIWAVAGELAGALEATVEDQALVSNTTAWTMWTQTDANTQTFDVAVWLPQEAGNEYQGKEASISFMVEAVQANAGNIVSTSEDLAAAAKAGQDVSLVADMEAPLTYGTIYGTPAAVVQKGGVINGNGYELEIKNPVYEGYAIETWGGTIKNLTITSKVGRGIVISAPTQDIFLDNVVIDGPGYALNTTEHSPKNLVVTNSTINGWTSLAGLASVKFENCKLGMNTKGYWQAFGYDMDYDRLIRPYNNAEFKNCEFEQGYYIDLSALGASCVITLDNCTVNGVKLTAENYASYITVEPPSGRAIENCVTFA